jgi:hypothetical protein
MMLGIFKLVKSTGNQRFKPLFYTNNRCHESSCTICLTLVGLNKGFIVLVAFKDLIHVVHWF